MTQDIQDTDRAMLASLALALVERPRANLQELARAVGVSKATLYRFCPTREQLIERLMRHSIQVFTQATQEADLENTPPLEALRRLTANNLEHRELNVFLMYFWKPDTPTDLGEIAGWEAQLDAFFLRGQQAAAFRIDIPAAALTEIWVSMIVGLAEAERRGRIARTGLASMAERAFLQGIAAT